MPPPKTLTPASWLEQGRKVWSEFLLGRLGRRRVGRRLQQFVVATYLVGRGFIGGRGPTRAAALSYTTLLALVPLLAVMLSVSKNFLKESTVDFVPRLIDQAVGLVAPQLEWMPLEEHEYGPPAPGQGVMSSRARAETVAKIQESIDGIDAGALGTVGTIALVVIAIRLMTTIENTFNDIWGVTQGRSVLRRVVYYWSTLTLGPILIVLAMYLTGKIEYMKAYGEWFAGAAALKRIFLSLTPYLVLWLGFTAMYALMPNTRVHWHAALIGGVVGGTLWQINSLLSTIYISRVVAYSKLYGSLGIIPVFLVGLYFSWLIILFGAQVSFAAQNIHAYLQQHATDRVDQAGRELVACRMTFIACEQFLAGAKPPTIDAIADRLQVPSRLLNLILSRLREAGVLSELSEAGGGVVPARGPESLRIADVLVAMRESADAEAPPLNPTDGVLVAGVIEEIAETIRRAPANRTFAELVTPPAKS